MFKDDNQLEDFFNLKPKTDNPVRHGGIRGAIIKKVADRSKLRLLPRALSLKERYIVMALAIVVLGSVISIPFTTYHHFTKASPDYGGSFSEGISGKPRYINPLLTSTNDADKDLVNLIYSGLMKYNESGKLVPDLARSYEVSSDGLNYTIYMKDNASWHDGKKVTADDVIFTVQIAQNPDYGSTQRINWQGVDVKKMDDHTVMFTLKNKYAQFLNNLTLHILPAHLWQDVKPVNFALNELNLKPIGSGPYKFSKLTKDSLGQIQSYDLSANEQFYDGRPNINSMELRFYNSEDDLIDAYNRNEFQNLGFISAKNLTRVKFKQRLNILEIKMPRYFAAFFNQNQSNALSDRSVRLALSQATDQKDIINRLLAGKGLEVYSPMISNVLDIPSEIKKYQFDIDAAKKTLEGAGWATGSDGIRHKKSGKNDNRLDLTITTSTLPELSAAANILKNEWGAAGANVTVQALSTPELQQAIKDRNYQVLLFGAILNVDPDPFSLWHSSQKHDPGLNLALYDNKSADKLLEDARQTLDPLERARKYADFQNIVVNDVPAVFLYDPFYLYGQTKDIKGDNSSLISMPSDRFSNITSWYIDTRRIWR